MISVLIPFVVHSCRSRKLGVVLVQNILDSRQFWTLTCHPGFTCPYEGITKSKKTNILLCSSRDQYKSVTRIIFQGLTAELAERKHWVVALALMRMSLVGQREPRICSSQAFLLCTTSKPNSLVLFHLLLQSTTMLRPAPPGIIFLPCLLRCRDWHLSAIARWEALT